MRMLRVVGLAAAISLAGGVCGFAQSSLTDEAKGKVWWAHVQYLAGDRG